VPREDGGAVIPGNHGESIGLLAHEEAESRQELKGLKTQRQPLEPWRDRAGKLAMISLEISGD
jgi:hypothetical protein